MATISAAVGLVGNMSFSFVTKSLVVLEPLSDVFFLVVFAVYHFVYGDSVHGKSVGGGNVSGVPFLHSDVAFCNVSDDWVECIYLKRAEVVNGQFYTMLVAIRFLF